ncbi:HlyC/CorC family transporter [bacterium]|nr:HlyC/CorC family transporter [bacterium]
MDPSLQNFLDHLHSLNLHDLADAIATNNLEYVNLVLSDVPKPFEKILNSPEPFILLGLWVVMFLGCIYATAASTAANHLTIKDLIEDEHIGTDFINSWLKYADRIRVSLYILQAVALIYMTSCVNWFFDAFVVMPWLQELGLGVLLLLFVLVFASCVPWFVGVHFKKDIPIKHFGFLKFISNVMRPVNGFCLFLTRKVVKGAGYDITEEEVLAKSNDVEELLKDESEKKIDENEHEMLQSVFAFGDTIAREVMTPRPVVCAVEENVPGKEAVKAAIKDGHMRIPVYSGTIDNIIGILHIKDVMDKWSEGEPLPSLSAVVRKPYFIPETKRVAELLIEMRKTNTQIAVVVDEYGGMAGIITATDIISEIVGEMPEENIDPEAPEVLKIDETTYEMAGTVLVDDLNDMLELNLPDDESFDSIGGYALYKLGHLPVEGEEVKIPAGSLKILKIINNRIEKLQLKLKKNE